MRARGLLGRRRHGATSPTGSVVFDDFADPTLRPALDGTNLVQAYTGVNPDQTTSLDTVAGAFKIASGQTRFSGTSSGGNTTTTFNDSSASFPVPGSWADLGGPQFLAITGGTGAGQAVQITRANSATQLQVYAGTPFATVPDATSTYKVLYSTGPYLNIIPCGTSIQDYRYPQGYFRTYCKGTYAPGATRLSWRQRFDRDMARLLPDNGDVFEAGTYVRQFGSTALNDQGQHYYHNFNPNWFANEWSYLEINRHPQHQRANDPNVNWPDDPENTAPILIVLATFTGTVAVTNGSNVVNGSGTNFQSIVSPGQWVRFSSDASNAAYKVFSVPSQTQLTLGDSLTSTTQPYLGATASGLTASYVTPLPSPLPSGATVGDMVVPSSFQQPIGYFDALTEFYLDLSHPDLMVPGQYAGAAAEYTDLTFGYVTDEEDVLVSSIWCTYNPNAGLYELGFSGPKGIVQAYDIHYGLSPLKATDGSGSYNGAGSTGGTGGGTVATPGGYPPVWWQSPAMARQSTIYFLIVPHGQARGKQVTMTAKS